MDNYWRTIWRALLLGVFGGLFGLAYLVGVEEAIHLIWPEWESSEWFSGNLAVVSIPIVAGLLVGVIYKVFKLPPRFDGFIEELEAGEVEPNTAPGAIGIAVISLVGGASLGPEAPLGTAGGAAGTWLARRRGGDDAEVRQATFMGISAAFGGLMSTPIGGPLLAFELEHDQSHNYYYQHLVPGIIAGAVSFGVMWPVIGAPFEGLLAIPRGEFESWMLLAAVGIGVFAAVAALVVGKIMVAMVGALRPLDSRPVLRGLVGGSLVAAIGFTLPLTLFSGQTTLPVILAEFETYGLLLLVALAVFKAVALGASLGGGFYGGPIFPLFFIGAVLGIAVHVVFPSLPLGLAVGSTMAALGAAVAMLPLSMAVLSAILIGSGLEAFAAIVLASAVAYALRYALMQRRTASDVARSASPTSD